MINIEEIHKAQPQWHYEQIYIRHLDGHAGDETDSEEDPDCNMNMTLAEYEIMIKT